MQAGASHDLPKCAAGSHRKKERNDQNQEVEPGFRLTKQHSNAETRAANRQSINEGMARTEKNIRLHADGPAQRNEVTMNPHMLKGRTWRSRGSMASMLGSQRKRSVAEASSRIQQKKLSKPSSALWPMGLFVQSFAAHSTGLGISRLALKVSPPCLHADCTRQRE